MQMTVSVWTHARMRASLGHITLCIILSCCNEIAFCQFQIKLIFYSIHAGQLTADVKNGDGAVPVEIVQKDRDKYSVSFIPRIYGESV